MASVLRHTRVANCGKCDGAAGGDGAIEQDPRTGLFAIRSDQLQDLSDLAGRQFILATSVPLFTPIGSIAASSQLLGWLER